MKTRKGGVHDNEFAFYDPRREMNDYCRFQGSVHDNEFAFYDPREQLNDQFMFQ